MEEVNNGTITALPIPDAGHMNRHGRFEQIEAVPDQNGEHSLYALDTKGVVWKYVYDPGASRWVPLVMDRAAH